MVALMRSAVLVCKNCFPAPGLIYLHASGLALNVHLADKSLFIA